MYILNVCVLKNDDEVVLISSATRAKYRAQNIGLRIVTVGRKRAVWRRWKITETDRYSRGVIPVPEVGELKTSEIRN